MQSLFVTVLSIAVCLPAAAQVGGLPHRGEGGPPGFRFEHQKTVTGAPYSATVTNSIVEHIEGGNTIQHSTTGQVARDGVGRSYEQLTVEGGRLSPGTLKTLVFITDPVAGFSYVLNQADKTAVRRPFHQWSGNADHPRPARQQPNGGNAAVTQLGSDSSSGVAAEGESITHVIPAGQIGNSAPITSTVQRWYSAELQLVVKSVRTDPRFGQKTYALTNVVKGEPDPTLFQIPADYKVTDARAHDFGHGGPRPQ